MFYRLLNGYKVELTTRLFRSVQNQTSCATLLELYARNIPIKLQQNRSNGLGGDDDLGFPYINQRKIMTQKMEPDFDPRDNYNLPHETLVWGRGT